MIGKTNVGGGGSGDYGWGQYTDSSQTTFLGFVTSNKADAYPDDGTKGGKYYVKISQPDPTWMVTWSGGTDAQIVTMLDYAYTYGIDLSQYWSVGDERTVALSSMAATGVGESHAAQNITLVLMNRGGKTLSDGTTACQFIVGQKQMLNYAANSLEGGYMNSSNTNTGGWSSSARRTWCNNVYYNAMPSTLQPIFKQFTNTTGAGGGVTSGLQTTTDYFALPAEKEIFGTNTYSQSDEAAALTQFTYYATSANRIKYYSTSSAYYWWERSPRGGYSSDFCLVGADGSAYGNGASGTRGLAPFGCI